MNKVINKFKRKLYLFSLKMMLNDFKNGDLQLTGKQKSQLETLMWKVKYKLIQRQKIDSKAILERRLTMDFKKGDRVLHKNLQMKGTFVEYDWTGKDESWVDFDNEDGYEDCRHISTNQLILIEEQQ